MLLHAIPLQIAYYAMQSCSDTLSHLPPRYISQWPPPVGMVHHDIRRGISTCSRRRHRLRMVCSVGGRSQRSGIVPTRVNCPRIPRLHLVPITDVVFTGGPVAIRVMIVRSAGIWLRNEWIVSVLRCTWHRLAGWRNGSLTWM